jgi:uncharacterized membrane protein
MEDRSRRVYRSIKNNFLVGLVAILPIYVTINVVLILFNYVDHNVAMLIKQWFGLHIPGVGVVSTFLIITLAGFLMNFVVIRRTGRGLEHFIEGIPFVRSVYTAVKQVVKPLVGDDPGSRAFKQVVTFEWPGNGLWVLGFLVKEEQKGPAPAPDDRVLVFLPTNPLHLGFVIATHRDRLHPVSMSIEEAIRTELSLGVAAPDFDVIGPPVAPDQDVREAMAAALAEVEAGRNTG